MVDLTYCNDCKDWCRDTTHQYYNKNNEPICDECYALSKDGEV